jgi:hypothetical protein
MLTIKNEVALLSQLIFFSYYYADERRLHFSLHIHLQGQYAMPLPYPHCEKLALFCNLNFTEVYINFEKYVIY